MAINSTALQANLKTFLIDTLSFAGFAKLGIVSMLVEKIISAGGRNPLIYSLAIGGTFELVRDSVRVIQSGSARGSLLYNGRIFQAGDNALFNSLAASVVMLTNFDDWALNIAQTTLEGTGLSGEDISSIASALLLGGAQFVRAYLVQNSQAWPWMRYAAMPLVSTVGTATASVL